MLPLRVSARVFLENLLVHMGTVRGNNLSERSDRESNRRSFKYHCDLRGSFIHCTNPKNGPRQASVMVVERNIHANTEIFSANTAPFVVSSYRSGEPTAKPRLFKMDIRIKSGPRHKKHQGDFTDLTSCPVHVLPSGPVPGRFTVSSPPAYMGLTLSNIALHCSHTCR